jgi:hypothetical protein
VCEGDQGCEVVFGASGGYMSQWGYMFESPSPCGFTGASPVVAGLKAKPVDVFGVAKI